MAGRGTDIVLGGNPEPEDQQDCWRTRRSTPRRRRSKVEEIRFDWQKLHNQVVAAGGLHIVGTERHESRRIDNQLRGRSGRQGDPGSSRFYLSLEDPLLRIFASDRVAAIMQRLKMPEGEAIEHPWVTRSIENAQRKVEARNFDIRKHLLEYDDVANDQRKVIYQQRNELLETDDITETLDAMRADVVGGYVEPAHSAGKSRGAVGPRRAGAHAGGRAAAEASHPAVAKAGARARGAGAARAHHRRRRSKHYRDKIAQFDAARDSSHRARDHAAERGYALARAPVRARPPAPGHTPAGLRPEEPDARSTSARRSSSSR